MITKLLNLSINRMESICDVTKQNEKKEFLLEKKKNSYICTEWFDQLLKDMQDKTGISSSSICKYAVLEFMEKYYWIGAGE